MHRDIFIQGTISHTSTVISTPPIDHLYTQVLVRRIYMSLAQILMSNIFLCRFVTSALLKKNLIYAPRSDSCGWKNFSRKNVVLRLIWGLILAKRPVGRGRIFIELRYFLYVYRSLLCKPHTKGKTHVFVVVSKGQFLSVYLMLVSK